MAAEWREVMYGYGHLDWLDRFMVESAVCFSLAASHIDTHVLFPVNPDNKNESQHLHISSFLLFLKKNVLSLSASVKGVDAYLKKINNKSLSPHFSKSEPTFLLTSLATSIPRPSDVQPRESDLKSSYQRIILS